MEPLLVTNDLHSDQSSVFVINATDHLTKAALSEHIDYLVTVREVITHHDVVIASIIVVTIVAGLIPKITHMFGDISLPEK